MKAGNPSEVSRESRIRELAVLDWAHIPSVRIYEELDLDYHTVSTYRQTDLYKSVVADLRAAHEEEMLKLPSTAALKKKVSHAMTLGVETLIEILSSKAAPYKDKLGAARLAAQMDGRFFHAEAPTAGAQDADSIATELLTALKRHQETIQ